jgi:hypothetical protein
MFPTEKLAICSIAKNRHGSTKNIAMQFTGSTMQFREHPILSTPNVTREVKNNWNQSQINTPF